MKYNIYNPQNTQSGTIKPPVSAGCVLFTAFSVYNTAENLKRKSVFHLPLGLGLRGYGDMYSVPSAFNHTRSTP